MLTLLAAIDIPSFSEGLEAILRLSTPIMFAAMGALLTLRAGIWNIGVEGFMLAGAFTAVLVSYYSGSAWLAVLAAVVTGAAVALVMAVFVLSLRVDEIVAGLALNALLAGLTIYLLVVIFDEQQSLLSDRIQALPNLAFLDSVPFVGTALANQTPLVIVAWLCAVAIAFLLSRTSFGLAIRAVGDAPEAALAAGINPRRVQYIVFALSGVLAAAGGAQLSIGFLSLFQENMTEGRGIIGFTAVIFGNGDVFRVALASVVFGFADWIAVVLQGSQVPNQIVRMMPFAVAIVAVTIGTVVRSRRRRYRFGHRPWRRRNRPKSFRSAS